VNNFKINIMEININKSSKEVADDFVAVFYGIICPDFSLQLAKESKTDGYKQAVKCALVKIDSMIYICPKHIDEYIENLNKLYNIQEILKQL